MVEMEVRKVTKGVESNMVAFDFERTPITQIADYIIITASNNGASDIHFDPRDDNMMVRFRIDGDLQDYTCIPKLYERTLTTRLKLLASMNITESRLPQDGAIKGEFGGKYLDMRVSCLPLNTGEKIVIRILDYTRSLQGVDNLGFNQTNLKKIRRMMGVPNGIILVTGATGSGKSTTVYSVLQELNRPEINIITVEDPIEMNIEGMNQVQVNAEIGMTFAAALRSILRQDPNIILIGEIRDSETAQIAVRASITGHLVLSTIHTNNALATIERLLDMDVERYLLSTSLTGIIAQRLAKQLCMSCRIERQTTKYEKKVFKKFMNRDVEKIYDANPKGCENCRKGYKGRIAIHEVLELDDEIRNAIANPKITKEELSKMVYGSKTISMLQDALGKAISGLTSFEEVYRVIELESDPDDDTAYLTRAIEDPDEEETTKKEVQTDGLDDIVKTTEQRKPNQSNIQNLPKFNLNGTEIKDIKNIPNNTNVQTSNQNVPNQPTVVKTPAVPTISTLTTPTAVGQQTLPQTPQKQATQAILSQQQASKAILPQVATLTKEQQLQQAQALAAKKAQEIAVSKQNHSLVQPAILTEAEAKIQAEVAKQKLTEQIKNENEKKLTEVLAKPQKITNEKLVVANPNLKPTPVTQIQQTTQQQKIQQETKSQNSNLYQLPKSSSEQIPQPKIIPPKIEKMENAIPELSVSIKAAKEQSLIPVQTTADSPINEEENTFDEKNKVKEIDINKISKSTDLKKEEKVITNPLKPTISPEEDNKKQNKNDSFVPIIIESFAVDDDFKNSPKLNEIKTDAISQKELGPVNMTTKVNPKITEDSKNIEENPVKAQNNIELKIDKTPVTAKATVNTPKQEDIKESLTVKNVKPKIEKGISITEIPTPKISDKTANTTKKESKPIIKQVPTVKTSIPTIVETPRAEKAKNISQNKNQNIITTPLKQVKKIESPSQKEMLSKELKTNNSIIPTIEFTKNTNKIEENSVKRSNEEYQATIEKENNLKLPPISIPKTDTTSSTKETQKVEDMQMNTLINKTSPNIFELPVVNNNLENNFKFIKNPSSDQSTEKKPFITEMKQTTPVMPKASTTGKEDTIKNSSPIEKKPFITEMKQTTPVMPKADTTKKEDTINNSSPIEKKPFITEMKQTTPVMPKASTTGKEETIKNSSPIEKKPFITEMKQATPVMPKADTTKKEDTISNNSPIDKKTLTTESKLPKISSARSPETTKKEILKDEKEVQKAENISKPATNILNENSSKDKAKTNDNTELLDLNIDGELLALGED